MNTDRALATIFRRADRAVAAALSTVEPIRMLDISRQITTAIPYASALVVDVSQRWDTPYGPDLVKVRTLDATWDLRRPPEWLAHWTGPGGQTWPDIAAAVQQHVHALLGTADPDDVGWEPDDDHQYRLDLLDVRAVDALTAILALCAAPDPAGNRGPWVYLPHFGPDGPWYARVGCPSCHGDGLVPGPHGETDNCPCIRIFT